MKSEISILLPYKEKYTLKESSAASIWVKDFNKKSTYKKNITVFGNTDNSDDLIDKQNYKNINFDNYTFKSKNISYVDEFINLIKKFSISSSR